MAPLPALLEKRVLALNTSSHHPITIMTLSSASSSPCTKSCTPKNISKSFECMLFSKSAKLLQAWASLVGLCHRGWRWLEAIAFRCDMFSVFFGFGRSLRLLESSQPSQQRAAHRCACTQRAGTPCRCARRRCGLATGRVATLRTDQGAALGGKWKQFPQ